MDIDNKDASVDAFITIAAIGAMFDTVGSSWITKRKNIFKNPPAEKVLEPPLFALMLLAPARATRNTYAWGFTTAFSTLLTNTREGTTWTNCAGVLDKLPQVVYKICNRGQAPKMQQSCGGSSLNSGRPLCTAAVNVVAACHASASMFVGRTERLRYHKPS
eukprot:1162052-Pelagomonas_calceolata.AAC.2